MVRQSGVHQPACRMAHVLGQPDIGRDEGGQDAVRNQARERRALA